MPLTGLREAPLAASLRGDGYHPAVVAHCLGVYGSRVLEEQGDKEQGDKEQGDKEQGDTGRQAASTSGAGGSVAGVWALDATKVRAIVSDFGSASGHYRLMCSQLCVTACQVLCARVGTHANVGTAACFLRMYTVVLCRDTMTWTHPHNPISGAGLHPFCAQGALERQQWRRQRRAGAGAGVGSVHGSAGVPGLVGACGARGAAAPARPGPAEGGDAGGRCGRASLCAVHGGGRLCGRCRGGVRAGRCGAMASCCEAAAGRSTGCEGARLERPRALYRRVISLSPRPAPPAPFPRRTRIHRHGLGGAHQLLPLRRAALRPRPALLAAIYGAAAMGLDRSGAVPGGDQGEGGKCVRVCVRTRAKQMLCRSTAIASCVIRYQYSRLPPQLAAPPYAPPRPIQSANSHSLSPPRVTPRHPGAGPVGRGSAAALRPRQPGHTRLAAHVHCPVIAVGAQEGRHGAGRQPGRVEVQVARGRLEAAAGGEEGQLAPVEMMEQMLR